MSRFMLLLRVLVALLIPLGVFTARAAQAARPRQTPRLVVSVPSRHAVIVGSTLNVSYTTAGPVAAVDHVHFRVDGGADVMDTSFDGSHQFAGLSPGFHTLDGFLVRADHSKINGSDAATVPFIVASPSDPVVIGKWNAPVPIPTVAVDLVLLHTGKVLFWAGEFATAPNFGELWDPATNAITHVPNPFSNIFCSSHVQLADGRILVAGGHDLQNGILGLAKSSLFNPVSETWTALPSMAFRRWYPTLTALSDGRAIVNSGSSFSESEFVDTPEIYDPVANTWTQLTSARLAVPQYPMMFLLPDGRLLQSGTTEYTTATRTLDLATQQWTLVDDRLLEGGSAAMFEPGRIMKTGSASVDGTTPSASSSAATYVLDMTEAAPAWRETTPMAFARTFHTVTMLPDGTAMVSGGSQRKSETNLTPAVLEAELWSPQTEAWTTLAPMTKARIYHGSAVLLPDARVAVAGGGNIPGGTDMLSVEVYTPPYLFKGPRPTVTSAPGQLEYGASFTVETPAAATIRKVSLLRPGAATHAFDQDQRFVPLLFTPSGTDRLEVQAPADSNLAPPGYYMLFLIDEAGVPSVATFVRLPAPYEAPVTDFTPPAVALTAPGDTETVQGVVAVTATASDDVAVAGVQFRLDGIPLGPEDGSAPYSFSWNSALVPNGGHVLTAVARDAANNTATSFPVNVVVANSQQIAGLVAAYGFEEGAGATASDASGNGNTGSVSGATWTTSGRTGGALSFDGNNDFVSVADAASLGLSTAMTLEAWVYPTAASGWRNVIMKETGSDLAWALYSSSPSSRPEGYVRTSNSSSVSGPGALPLNAWTHLALTYDGAVMRIYQNGVEVGSQAKTGNIATSGQPLRIGGNSIWGEYFSGRIDEVRIYNRALAAAEIVSGMNGGVPTAPRLMISQPANGATLAGATVSIGYAINGNPTGVEHVMFRLDGGSEIEDPSPGDGSFEFSGVAPGSHTIDGHLAGAGYAKIAGSDAATAGFTLLAPDGVPPAVVISAPRTGDTVQGVVAVTATATDDVAVAGVQFRLDGIPLGPEDGSPPYSYSWNTASVSNGGHVLTAVARDAANNSATSFPVNVVVANAQQITGLVAAYGFEEGAGATASDASGNGNTGSVSGATWTTSGRTGGALSFDGNNDFVSVADAASLGLSTAMTLEAWVYPTAASGWRNVIMKETGSDLAWALYSSSPSSRPEGYVRTSNSSSVSGPGALPLNAWTHLALTYDGAVMRIYQNGVEVGSQAKTGNIATSSQSLRIGGNSIWGEYFSGRIDEVRIYNRALTPAEIAADRDAPVVRQAQPTRSSPIVVDPVARRVWTVNPDNDSVTAVGADSLLREFEVPVGRHPTSIAIDGFGQVWVTCRDDDSIWVLDGQSGSTLATVTLPWGSAPVSVVFSPDRIAGFVAAYGTGLVHRVDAFTRSAGASLDIGPTPRALAVTADGSELLVTQFLTRDGVGKVHSVSLPAFGAGTSIELPLDTTSQDGSVAARGAANYLAGIAIDPESELAWVVAKKDNVLRGLFRDGRALTFETTVRALVGVLDPGLGQELVARRLDIDNHGVPSAIAFSESGSHAFVTLQDNNRLIVFNALGLEVARADTGLAPQGVAIDSVSKRVFTHDFLSRTITVLDGTTLLGGGTPQLPRIAQIVAVSAEALDPVVLRGKQIFYDASDPRMAKDGYLSCAACHIDGDHDGQVWDFSDRGEGLRNTISLRGQGGVAGAPLHWSGNFDEVQDFEGDIRNFFGGTGFLSDAASFSGTRSQPLGDPKAGISADLDALAGYVDSLTDTPRSPQRDADGAMTPEAIAGEALFGGLGCGSCHAGPRFSDSNTGLRHDVGTLLPSSGLRLGGPLDGIDTPMLPGLAGTAPYLHDGSAPTVRDVLTTANPAGLHGDLMLLSPAQIDELVAYLLQLELAEP